MFSSLLRISFQVETVNEAVEYGSKDDANSADESKSAEQRITAREELTDVSLELTDGSHP